MRHFRPRCMDCRWLLLLGITAWAPTGEAGLAASLTETNMDNAETQSAALIETYVAKYKPLTIAANLAWWDASISGTDADFQKRKDAENRLVELHSDTKTFDHIKSLRAGAIGDAVIKRQLDMMYYNFLPYQADPELSKRIVSLEADVEQIFNTHRSLVGGKETTENEVRKILTDTKDSNQAREAWRGYMQVGQKVNAKLTELVKLRNQVAKKLGYANYFTMKLDEQELEEKELFRIFDELDELTRAPFTALKEEIDAMMLKRFSLAKADLRPWHTGDLFFQEAPVLGGVNLDEMIQSKDPVKLSADHYESMGMEVRGILARSDLYEKEGKSPHAFCTSIDRDQDVRVLCNVKPNANWMDTVHHEIGHAVYDQYIAKDVPFILHEPSHILTTEGIAMLFGAITKNEEFISKIISLPESELAKFTAAGRRSLRAEKLIFSRWTQVMLRFEQAMYDNPDQDLNKLWWSLKKRYQLLNPPNDMSGSDFGAKLHIVAAPVYYHNYMLGELFATQLHSHIAKTVIGVDSPHRTAFVGSKQAGQYLRDKVFAPGNLYRWDDLTRRVTGEPLSAKAFAQQYVH